MCAANFKILTLGTSGAGKTVFLASMFKQLFSQGDAQFNLKVDNPAQRKQLNSIYTQLINRDQWPEGTRGYSEWTFTCRVETEDLNNYTACQFTYFDYAGGRITDEEFEPEFLEMINQSHAILCLLDGHKIYKWLSSDSLKHETFEESSAKQPSDVANFLHKELPKILDCIQLSKAPIQFVISKWDLLEDRFELETICDRLLAIPQFQQVVQKRSEAGSIVRLIPVSAVGSGFARLDENGEMKRIPGAIPLPEWVEVPIACVLPDQLKFQLNEVEEEQQQLGKPGVSLTGIAGGFFNILGGGLDKVGWAIGNLVDDPVAELTGALLEGVGGFSKGIGSFLRKGAEERREQLETSLAQVKDEQSALNHAIESFLNIQQELLEAYPESEITLSSMATASIEAR